MLGWGPQWLVWTALHLLLVSSQELLTAKDPGKGLCKGYLVHILDLNVFAASKGYPQCVPEERVVVNAGSGIVYLPEDDHAPGFPDRPFDWSAHHKFGTHAAPWYLAQALKSSECYTDDIEKAQAVYVYDYCYYIWWLATLHSRGGEMTTSPGDHLIQGWNAVLETPRWKRTHGRDFVFYDPHPGFASGDAAPIFRSMQCNELRKSTQLIVDYGMRTHCQAYWEMRKLVVTPNVPNFVNISNPLDTFKRPVVPLEQRKMLMYFSGRCGPYDDGNLGKLFRFRVVQAINATYGTDPTVDVHCSEEELGGRHETFEGMLSAMEHSEFCLVLPGDSQSTRRLSEIFLGGCIPVFVGPPYNSLPFPVDIDYRHASVFFNVTNTSDWLPEPVRWHTIDAAAHARHPNDAVWWLPDIDVSDVAIQIDNMTSIGDHLKHMPTNEKLRRLQLMVEYRHRMTFQEQPTNPPNAVNSLLGAITRVMRRLHRVRQTSGLKGDSTAKVF